MAGLLLLLSPAEVAASPPQRPPADDDGPTVEMYYHDPVQVAAWGCGSSSGDPFVCDAEVDYNCYRSDACGNWFMAMEAGWTIDEMLYSITATVDYSYTFVDCCNWQGSCPRSIELRGWWDPDTEAPSSFWHAQQTEALGTLNDGQSVSGQKVFYWGVGGAGGGPYATSGFNLRFGFDEDYVHMAEGRVELVELVVNGHTIFASDDTTETECVPIESVELTGPVSATVAQAAEFQATASPSSATNIEWSWDASSDGLPDFSTDDGNQSTNRVTWWTTGTQVVTATATNACSTVSATTTISITWIPFDPPFDPEDPEPPPPYPDCDCPRPDLWINVPKWIEWLWCKLRCWFYYFLDWLWYLWKLLEALLMRLVNAIIEWLWDLLIKIWIFLHEGFTRVVYWLRGIIKAINESGWRVSITDWINCVVHNISVWWNWQTREVGTWLGESWDNYAYFVAESYWNLQDFVTTQIRVKVISRWFNESWANVVNWAKDTVQAQTQGGYWQWEEITDYLSDTVKAWRDWILGLEDAVIDWLNEQSEYMGYVWLQDFSDAIRAWLNHYAARIIEAMAPGYYTARGVIEGIRDLWDQIKAKIYGIITGFTTSIVETVVSAFSLIEFARNLVGELIIGFRDAISAETEAELYEGYGDLYYFFRGLQFFEDAAGDSPLAVLNLVSLGMIGVGLLYWTIGQVGDFFDDISRL